jgi:hypothetical protein
MGKNRHGRIVGKNGEHIWTFIYEETIHIFFFKNWVYHYN